MPDGATPETTGYLLLGLAAIALILLILIGAMLARYRSYQRDLQTLEEIEDDNARP
jgi:hypothetical protein